ncbi:MAG TPA: pilus assembly protein TadG-related protein [Roseiarcus sp.]|jgi:Flp pilus assembly protein TadG
MTRVIFHKFIRDRRANVAMIFGFMAIPLIFSVGMAIDYGAAARLKSKLNAAADAAVLAAVTPAMMTQSDAASITAAKNMFNAQVTGLSRLIFDITNTTDFNVTVADVGLARNVTVSYNAQSQNIFGGILNMNTISFGGSSTGSAATPPNIDFYLLLDTSPSMAIAGTPADIQTMVNNTSSQGGCAFACHEANPSADNLGNPGGEDNYALARSLGVTLRADLLDGAITDLTNTAFNAENNPAIAVQPVYRMSINSFDVGFNKLVPLTSNFVSTWSTQLASMQSNNTQTLEVYDNNNACSPTTTTTRGVTTTNPCGAGTGNSDADTNYDTAMSNITALIPSPAGGGTNKAGDTPQEILFIVTDGVEDEMVSGSRQESTMTGTKDWCTPLKSNGIKIAILYTEYFPLPTNSWYNAHVAPYQSSIGTTLQNCASSGLFYEVGLGQNISAALNELFQSAVASAHLTQ